MISLHVDAPYATFRKSFARSFAETYPLPPPATVYGMLLSLIGERFRQRHEGARLAFAYSRLPRIATTLRKLSRYKYGVAAKQSSYGNAPDYIETLCGIDMICWVDSSNEFRQDDGPDLESRILQTLKNPESVDRYGVLSLGLSDDAVNEVKQVEIVTGNWLRLLPSSSGILELPTWVDHVGSSDTKWQRYSLDTIGTEVSSGPSDEWEMTSISRR